MFIKRFSTTTTKRQETKKETSFAILSASHTFFFSYIFHHITLFASQTLSLNEILFTWNILFRYFNLFYIHSLFYITYFQDQLKEKVILFFFFVCHASSSFTNLQSQLHYSSYHRAFQSIPYVQIIRTFYTTLLSIL